MKRKPCHCFDTASFLVLRMSKLNGETIKWTAPNITVQSILLFRIGSCLCVLIAEFGYEFYSDKAYFFLGIVRAEFFCGLLY